MSTTIFGGAHFIYRKKDSHQIIMTVLYISYYLASTSFDGIYLFPSTSAQCSIGNE